MGVRRFNDPNTGRWAPVLTHINAVIGWDNKSLSTILEEIISKVDDKEAENADDIEIWQMEPGKVYVKDGKLHICVENNGEFDYEVITVGSDGLKVVGRDGQGNPPYTEDVYRDVDKFHIATSEYDFRVRALRNPGFWLIPGDVNSDYDGNIPKVAYVSNPTYNNIDDEYVQYVYAFCYDGTIVEAYAYGDTEDDTEWYHEVEDTTVIWNIVKDLKDITEIQLDNTILPRTGGTINIPLASISNNGAMSSSDKSFINKFLCLLGGSADNYDLSDMGQSLDVTGSYDGNNNLLNYYAAITDNSENAGIVISTTSKTSTPSVYDKQLLISPSGIYFRKGTSSNNWGSWELVGGGITTADKTKLDAIRVVDETSSEFEALTMSYFTMGSHRVTGANGNGYITADSKLYYTYIVGGYPVQQKMDMGKIYYRGCDSHGVWNNWTAYVDAKAPINSPSLTGTPTAPTAASGTNTTQIATTAFVQGELANRYPMVTITEADYQDLVDDNEVDPNVLYVIVDNT